MKTPDTQSEHLSQLQDQTKRIVESAADIQQQVRNMTLERLQQDRLTMERIADVMHAAMKGAVEGVARLEQPKEALVDAIAGLEEAMQKSAEAIKLSLEEATGKINEFAKDDIKSAIDEMQKLQSTFTDILGGVLRSSTNLSDDLLRTMIAHVESSGHHIGTQTDHSMRDLRQSLERVGKESVEAGVATVRKMSSELAAAASGFLAGLAEALANDGRATKAGEQQEKKHD